MALVTLSGYHTPIGAWVIWLCQGKCLALTASPDPRGRNKAIMSWVFQPLPQPVGFTWELIYESGSPTPLKGCVVRVASPPKLLSAISRSFHHACTFTRSYTDMFVIVIIMSHVACVHRMLHFQATDHFLHFGRYSFPVPLRVGGWVGLCGLESVLFLGSGIPAVLPSARPSWYEASRAVADACWTSGSHSCHHQDALSYAAVLVSSSDNGRFSDCSIFLYYTVLYCICLLLLLLYAMQYKQKYKKSSLNEPYSSFSFTKQSCSKMALYCWILLLLDCVGKTV